MLCVYECQQHSRDYRKKKKKKKTLGYGGADVDSSRVVSTVVCVSGLGWDLGGGEVMGKTFIKKQSLPDNSCIKRQQTKT